MLAKNFLLVYHWTGTESKSIHKQKRTRLMKSHLDRTSLVYKGYTCLLAALVATFAHIVRVPSDLISPVMRSKLKLVTIQQINSRIWDMIDDNNINNLAKNNQVSAGFHSRAIRKSVSPKFIELCMETPCLCPSSSEGHKHGGRDVTKTSVVEFCC